jgi:hypothetical protein
MGRVNYAQRWKTNNPIYDFFDSALNSLSSAETIILNITDRGGEAMGKPEEKLIGTGSPGTDSENWECL